MHTIEISSDNGFSRRKRFESYLKINDLYLEFEYSQIECQNVEYQPVELGVPRECHVKTAIQNDHKIFLVLQRMGWLLTLLDSGRHECCWPGTRTSFSISWFNPSTELRIGRWDELGRTGIVTGLAVELKIDHETPRRISIDVKHLLWLGLNVCELTECSPPRCTLCSLCLTIFSIFPSPDISVNGTKWPLWLENVMLLSQPPIIDSSVCVALSNCNIVKAEACCCNCCCNWIWWAIFHDGFIYSASSEAVRRIPDAESTICCLLTGKQKSMR